MRCRVQMMREKEKRMTELMASFLNSEEKNGPDKPGKEERFNVSTVRETKIGRGFGSFRF